MTSALIVSFESPLDLFYLGPVAYRVRIDVRQLVVFPLPIGCLFQIVVLSSLACLRPTASHRYPSWSPWVAENHVGSCVLSHKSRREGLAIVANLQTAPNLPGTVCRWISPHASWRLEDLSGAQPALRKACKCSRL